MAKILGRDDDGLDQGWEATLEYVSLRSSHKQGELAGPVPAIDVLLSQKKNGGFAGHRRAMPAHDGGET